MSNFEGFMTFLSRRKWRKFSRMLVQVSHEFRRNFPITSGSLVSLAFTRPTQSFGHVRLLAQNCFSYKNAELQ